MRFGYGEDEDEDEDEDGEDRMAYSRQLDAGCMGNFGRSCICVTGESDG